MFPQKKFILTSFYTILIFWLGLSACQKDAVEPSPQETILSDSTSSGSDTDTSDNDSKDQTDDTSEEKTSPDANNPSEPDGSPEDKDSCSGDSSPVVFLEKEGLLVIEAENTQRDEQWNLKKALAGYTGSGYIEWRGPDNMQKPGEGLHIYRIRISKTGTYRIQLRTYIAEGNNSTEHNDVWLRLPDATNFYGEKADSHRVYPKGSGKTPEPEGAGKDGWFKSYYNRTNEWGWRTATSDHDPHDIYAEFSEAGDYTIELSGRSSGFAVDRIVLHHTSVSKQEATQTERAESAHVCN